MGKQLDARHLSDGVLGQPIVADAVQLAVVVVATGVDVLSVLDERSHRVHLLSERREVQSRVVLLAHPLS